MKASNQTDTELTQKFTRNGKWQSDKAKQSSRAIKETKQSNQSKQSKTHFQPKFKMFLNMCQDSNKL